MFPSNWVGDSSAKGAEILAHKVVRSKDAITREDLIETLLVLAQKNSQHAVYAELKDKIAAVTPDFDPQTLLAHVRRTALELSVERPDLAAAVVRSAALARSPLAGLASEVFGVFDSTMDRVSARFTAQSRKVVAIFGIAVALALPLDTFDLLKRLARSDSAQEQAVALSQTFAENQSGADPRREMCASRLRNSRPPRSSWFLQARAEWLARWQQVNWAGVAVSALLLTLGGPFWFTRTQGPAQTALRRTAVRNRKTARSVRQRSPIRRRPRAESEAPYERHPQALLAQKFHAGATRRVAAGGHRDSHFRRLASLRRRLVQQRRRRGLGPLLRWPRRRSASICQRGRYRLSRREPRESDLAITAAACES